MMDPRVVGTETVYAVAQALVERWLRTDDSLFEHGKCGWESHVDLAFVAAAAGLVSTSATPERQPWYCIPVFTQYGR